jgi:hypothetical protein
MSISYSRTGGFRPPRDREILEIQDTGEFTMWRSIGWATDPPSPIGRFSGEIDEALNARLHEEAAAAAKAGNLQMKLSPDSPVETIQIGEAKATVGANDEAEGPWGDVVRRLRKLLSDLTRHPQAAIALEVSKDGQTARLVHHGKEPLRLDLTAMTVRAVLWEEYDKPGDWRSPSRHSGDMANIEAGVGWSLDLPFDHGFEVGGKREVVAYVTFTVFDAKRAVPVSLQSPRKFRG